MNLQDKYKYKSYNGRYTQKHSIKYHVQSLQQIKFINDYSVNNSSLNFTNYFQREESKRGKIIKEIIDNCIKDPTFFEKNFYGSEITNGTKRDRYKIERLYRILNLYNKFEIPISNVFKYKPNQKLKEKCGNEGGFQLIFTVENNIVCIYLIDLYHLAIPSEKDLKGNKFVLKNEYQNRAKYKKCMSFILFNKELQNI